MQLESLLALYTGTKTVAERVEALREAADAIATAGAKLGSEMPPAAAIAGQLENFDKLYVPDVKSPL